MKLNRLLVLPLAATIVSAGAAAAQHAAPAANRADGRGPVVGLQLSGGGIHTDGVDDGRPAGGGLGLSLGYGVSDRVMLFARGSMGYRMAHVDVGARYRFGGANAALRPYVEGAFTRVGSSSDVAEPDVNGVLVEGAYRAQGFGLTAGAGVEYAITRSLGLDVGVALSRGRFTTAEVGGVERDIRDDFRTARVNVGLTWRP